MDPVSMAMYGLFGIPVYAVMLFGVGTMAKMFWDFCTTKEVFHGPKKDEENK